MMLSNLCLPCAKRRNILCRSGTSCSLFTIAWRKGVWPEAARGGLQPLVASVPWSAVPVPLELQWLAMKETDDEKTKARKKKLLKSFKSKIRFQNMDLAQKQKQDTWQSFLKGKGSKKKTGFLTGKTDGRWRRKKAKRGDGASGRRTVVGLWGHGAQFGVRAIESQVFPGIF